VTWAHTHIVVWSFALPSDQVDQMLSLYTQTWRYWPLSARKSSGLGNLV